MLAQSRADSDPGISPGRHPVIHSGRLPFFTDPPGVSGRSGSFA